MQLMEKRGSRRLLQLSAGSGALASLLLIVGSSLPPGETLSNTLLALAGFLTPLWMTGVYRLQRHKIDKLGRSGYIIGVVGVLLISARLLAAILETGLGIIEIQRLFATQPGALITGISIAMFVWGVMALGTASLVAGEISRTATVLWMVGLMQTVLSISALSGLFAIAGITWSSYSLWMSAGVERNGISPATPPESSLQATSSKPGGRMLALDALRGLIMILMAIDHASLFIRRSHPFELWNIPLPHYDSAAAFLTRFVTHPCAPGFFFLMGAGVILFAASRRQMGWSQLRIARHLALRGLLLILLEQLVLDPILGGEVNFKDLQVFYGLGGVLVVCALLVGLNRYILMTIGIGIILATQVLPPALQDLGLYPEPLSLLLLVPGGSQGWFVLYPVFPWSGISLLGMAFGHELLRDRERGYRLALWMGGISLALFLVVRMAGGFGNLRPAAGTGWIDFLNMVKYPPSLVFTLLTLGINLILLYLFTRAGNWLEKWGKPLLAFGKAPLFFFLMHWFLYAAAGLYFLQPGRLPPMYLAWALGLLLLYPVCVAYGNFKRGTPPESVWRLF